MTTDNEPIWNTRVTVIDLIPATDADEAISRLSAALDGAGFDVHIDVDTQDAFESEQLDDDAERRARDEWRDGRFHAPYSSSSGYVPYRSDRRW